MAGGIFIPILQLRRRNGKEEAGIMITVVFDEKNEYARAAGLWQWDYGQVLRIQGLTLPTAVEIHFSLAETGGQAISRVGVTRDGVTEVVIPDSMLENGPAAGSQYTIYAWLYLTDSTSGQTIRRISLQVRTRSKPEPFDTPEAEELFRRAIDTVNEAVKKAEDIGTGAETAAGEAKTAASEAGKSLEAVQRLADQVQLDADAAAQDKIAVEKIAAQAQESAFMAGLSEQSARTSETAAKQAQAGAEAAEDASRQHAEAAEEDRMEVSEARKAVEQAVANIVADRELIQQNAKDLADVKNELTEKADVIVESANGNGYCIPVSADEPLRSLRILGKSTQNGDPSPESPVPIVNAGDKGDINVSVSGKNLINIGTVTFNQYKSFSINIPAGTYTFSASVESNDTDGNTCLVMLLKNGKNVKSVSIRRGNRSSAIITLKDNCDEIILYASFGFNQSTNDTATYTDAQLEYGTAVTEYEPYKPAQTLIIPTPGGLPGIPVSSGGNYTDENGQLWVTDEVDLAKGVHIKRIEQIASYNNESINGLYISETGELTVGARVLFALDASVETPLLPETIAAFRKLCMNYPVTTITNSDNCGMEVAYTADTKAYIDGKIAEISAAIVSK